MEFANLRICEVRTSKVRKFESSKKAQNAKTQPQIEIALYYNINNYYALPAEPSTLFTLCI